MIKRLLTKFLITIIVLLNTIFAFYPTTVFAAETAEFYGIEISNINNDLVKRYVQSLYLKPEGSAYRLIVNNTSIGSVTNTGTLYYYPNSNVKIGFNVDIPNKKITFSYNQIKTKNITAKFVFHATEFDSKDWQKITIYPNTEIGTNTTLSAELNGGWFRFPSYTYTYDSDNSFTYTVSINTNTNTCYIDCNGSIHNYSLSGGTVEKTLYVEAWINAQELELNYLEKLDPYNFATASSHTTLYSDEQINNAVSSFTGDKRLVLKNTPTGLTTDFALLDSIYYMERTSGGAEGTGSYAPSTPTKVKVICEYWDTEHMCETVRSTIANGDRLYAVIPYGQKTNEIISVDMSVPRNNAKIPGDILYYWPSNILSNQKIEYSKRNATWSNWDAYNPDVTRAEFCGYDEDCEWKSGQFYRYRTKGWTDWSSWTTTRYTDSMETEMAVDTKAEYSNWQIKTSQSGSYADHCNSFYEQDPLCGSTTNYSNFGNYQTSKYGYTERCNSRTGTNVECGSSSWSYYDYSNYRTSTYGDYPAQCISRSGRNSECGTESYVSSYTCSRKVEQTCSRDKPYSCTQTTYGTNCNVCGQTTTCNRCYDSSQKKYITNCTKCGKTVTCGSCNYNYQTTCHKTEYYDCSYWANDAPCYSSRNKSCTSYTCPLSATPVWNSCTSYSCAQTRTTVDNSCTLWNCPHTKTDYYRYRYRTYSDWSDYDYESCPTFPGVETQCLTPITKYSTRWRTWGNWGTWNIAGSAFNNTSDIQYRYRTITIGKANETINVINTAQKEINVMPRMTENQINEKAKEYDKAYAVSQTLDIAKSHYGENYVSTTEYWDWANGEGNLEYNSFLNSSIAGQIFKNSEIFVPYVYIAGHWRAQDKLFNIAAYDSQEKQMIKAIDVAEKGNDGPYDLITYEQEISRDSKVVYFDYHDPLANYEGNIPDDLEGLDELINKLENTDFSNAKISITISKSDMDNMKKWLKENNYKADEDCSFLKAFSYVFDEETRSKISSMACRTDEGN